LLKRIVSEVMLTLLFISMLTLAFNIQPVKAEPKTWTVDDDGPADFHTIQEAINAANPGDIIFVYNGTYYEQIIVDKSLTLVGESNCITIIDANKTFFQPTVEIVASNVNLSEFTIRNGYDGILVKGNNSVIGNNMISNNDFHGIQTAGFTHDNVMFNNTVTRNGLAYSGYCGIALDGYHHILYNNRILNNNGHGIALGSNDTLLQANFIANNGFGELPYYKHAGLVINRSYNNTIVENEIILNLEGINIFMETGNNKIYHNDIINNTEQVVTDKNYASINVWDDGYASGGNYWSDYTEVDANGDGIGDAPYVIDADNQDRYPLMHPWSPLPVHNINTGLGYATIQEAINAPETMDGHTIFVEAGTYYENIVVNKSISLIGEDRETTIIDGNRTGTVICMSACNVTITEFTIQNGDYGISLKYSHSNNITRNLIKNNVFDGIGVADSGANTIKQNVILNNQFGIYLSCSSDNTIEENTLRNNSLGIWLYYLPPGNNNNTIIKNTVTSNYEGVWIASSRNNSLFENIVVNNTQFGIRVSCSNNNTIVGNTVLENGQGVYLDDSDDNIIYHNNLINNTNQVYSLSSVNVWDEGYPCGGNYWSNYIGVDVKSGSNQDLPGSDGIGDTPYVIDADNVDHYPLMVPYGAPPPATYTLTITATVGGTTDPAPGTYSYTENSTVEVTAIPDAGYLFDYWELDGVNIGSANPFSVNINRDIILKAVFTAIPPPISVSINPLSASILVGESVTFTSTVSGGYTPYTYQWYLNDNPVSGATSDTWTFTPTTSGIFYVYLKVTDGKGNTTQSDTARITVSAMPVGGYSIPINVPTTTTKPITPYMALLAILTAIFTTIRRKTKRKH